MFYMIDKRHKKNKVVETKTHQVQLFPEYYINKRLLHIIGHLKKHCIQKIIVTNSRTNFTIASKFCFARSMAPQKMLTNQK